MDDAPLLSNSASASAASERPAVWLALEAWSAALGRLTGALRAYVSEIGDAGPRALGRRWAEAEAALSGPDVPSAAAPRAGAEPLASAMDAADACDRAALRLRAAGAVLLDPNAAHAAAAGMSRTFSGALAGLRKAVAARAAEASAEARAALEAAGAAGAALGAELGAAGAAAAYSAPGRAGGQRGAVATELYVSALACLRAAGSPEAGALLDSAWDAALGGAADTPPAAGAAAAALAGLHPCAAMCYTPAFAGPPTGEPANSAPVDLSFGSARLAVTYDLEPLVSRRRALEFGPLALVTSGLNYRLVERLRTIRATPAAPAPAASPGAPAPPALTDGPIVVSTGAGAPRAFGPPGRWAPFAGARPRVARYAEASAAVIFERLAAEREHTPADMRAQYEAAVARGAIPSGATDPAAVAAALAAAFERAYDAAPSATPDEYRALAAPDEPGPGDYIGAAAAALTGEALAARLRSAEGDPSPRVPFGVAERECRISQAVLTADVARALWRAVRDAFRPDPEAFDLPPVRRRETLLRNHRRIAAAAAAAAQVQCAPPSLKLWAAGVVRVGPRH